jgi:hypothetical protein
MLGEMAALDVNNLVNAFSSVGNKLVDAWGKINTPVAAPVVDTSSAQLQTISQLAKQNQTTLLTVGAVAVAGLVAYKLLRKK